MRILLEGEEVNPDRADKDGRTPLSRAARYGHEGVVKILLERADVNPNTADKDSKTPLFGAARNGHEGVVRILLETVFAPVQSVRLWGRTGRTTARSPSFWGC